MIALLTGLKNKMMIGLALAVCLLGALYLASQGENKRLSDTNAATTAKLAEISTTLADHTLQFENLNVAMTEVAETQERLDTTSREHRAFIDEISNDQTRTDDPFWNAFFERLRDDDASTSGQQPAAVP
jgi:hypothetical protein